MKGKTEIFVDNLPGGPDNINLAPDGSFWIALIEVYTLNTSTSKLDMHHGFKCRLICQLSLSIYLIPMTSVLDINVSCFVL